MSQPPKILRWLLDLVCPTSRQDLKGDFLELYACREHEAGHTNANFRFLSDILTTIPLLWIVKPEVKTQSPKSMLLTNLKIARRSLLRNKLYAVINIVGLSTSLAACLLITLFVRDELSFDRHFKDNDRIYRIAGQYVQSGDTRIADAATSFMVQPMIDNSFSGIELTGRIDPHHGTIVIGEQQFIQDNIIYTDSTFFDIFNLPFVSGDPRTALDDPSHVVIDAKTAEKFFGEEDAIGKSLVLEDKQFTVRGVIENLPANSHFTAEVIVPMSGVTQWYPDWVLHNISGRSVYTYIKVSEKFITSDFETQLNKLLTTRWGGDGAPQLFLQQLTSIHLGPPMQGEVKPNGTKTDIYIFTITACIILLLACINYVNLSMASALPRSKETGIKRVLGSTVRMVTAQFQTESFVVLMVSGALGSLIAWMFMPLLNQISGKNLSFNLIQDPLLSGGLILALFVIALISGTIPPLTLLRSGTINLLSGKMAFKPGKMQLGNFLIVFQFAIAVCLITATLIVVDQIRFVRNSDIGVNTEHMVLIPFQTNENAQKYDVWKAELLKNPNIKGVTASTNKVTGGLFGWRPYIIDPAKGPINIPTVTVAHDFFETMEAKLLEGRSFSKDFPSDATQSYILNEAAVALLELKKPIGTYVFGHAFNGETWTEINAHVVGVVQDFHFSSFHSKVEPVVFSLSSEITDPVRWMEIRITGNNIHGTIGSLEQTWSKLTPGRPFQFEFMDEAIANYYQSEEQFMKLFISFSILSILLGALGLFGLTAFMTKRRTKEIGIRKVIGASTAGLISLLARDFLKLVLVSNIIGWPVAWYLMDRWLQNFVLQTSIKWWIFAGTGLAAVSIAFVAILFHSLKVSRANPIKALRWE